MVIQISSLKYRCAVAKILQQFAMLYERDRALLAPRRQRYALVTPLLLKLLSYVIYGAPHDWKSICLDLTKFKTCKDKYRSSPANIGARRCEVDEAKQLGVLRWAIKFYARFKYRGRERDKGWNLWCPAYFPSLGFLGHATIDLDPHRLCASRSDDGVSECSIYNYSRESYTSTWRYSYSQSVPSLHKLRLLAISPQIFIRKLFF